MSGEQLNGNKNNNSELAAQNLNGWRRKIKYHKSFRMASRYKGRRKTNWELEGIFIWFGSQNCYAKLLELLSATNTQLWAVPYNRNMGSQYHIFAMSVSIKELETLLSNTPVPEDG